MIQNVQGMRKLLWILWNLLKKKNEMIFWPNQSWEKKYFEHFFGEIFYWNFRKFFVKKFQPNLVFQPFSSFEKCLYKVLNFRKGSRNIDWKVFLKRGMRLGLGVFEWSYKMLKKVSLFGAVENNNLLDWRFHKISGFGKSG